MGRPKVKNKRKSACITLSPDVYEWVEKKAVKSRTSFARVIEATILGKMKTKR